MELIYKDSVQAGRSKGGVIFYGFIFIIKKVNVFYNTKSIGIHLLGMEGRRKELL